MEEYVLNSVGEKDSEKYDDNKLGVKLVADSGALNTPKVVEDYPQTSLQIPVIDFQNIENPERRKQIVAEVQKASEQWGFFQAVNHGIPLSVLKGVIDGMRLFYEKDLEAQKQLKVPYDPLRKVRYVNGDWNDAFLLTVRPSNPIHADDLPQSCRSTTMEYLKYVYELGDTVCELLSEALGLKAEQLKAMKITKGHTSVSANYYPVCPGQALKMSTHTDATFFTILVQDHIPGLQVLHEDKWSEVEPVAGGGGLIINIGDLLQIVSNDKFKSVIHRVVVNKLEPRIAMGCFFHGSTDQSVEYGPIKDLVSTENPPLYRAVQIGDFMEKFFTKGISGEKLRLLHKL